MSATVTTLAALEATHSLAELQPGVTSIVRAATLTAANAGLTLAGASSTLNGTKQSGDFIERGALAIHAGWNTIQSEPKSAALATAVNPNEVAWLYNTTGDGSSLYPGPVTRYLPGASIPAANLTITRALKATPILSRVGVTLSVGPHTFAVGDEVFATDGPLINELIPEWRRVLAVQPSYITIDVPLERQYVAPVLCGGPVPRRMTFDGITFSGQMGPVFIGQSVDLVFRDCTFARNAFSNSNAGWLTIVGSGRLTFERCKIDSGLSISSSHDVTFRDCWIRRLIAEQCAYDVLLDRCRVGWLDSRIRCTGWTLRDSTFFDWLPVYDHWLVQNCRAFGPVVIRGYRCRIDGLRCPSVPYPEPGYQGAPPLAATEYEVAGVQIG